jgi:hypothetical protein
LSKANKSEEVRPVAAPIIIDTGLVLPWALAFGVVGWLIAENCVATTDKSRLRFRNERMAAKHL